jgi:UPF0716 protein FxsA
MGVGTGKNVGFLFLAFTLVPFLELYLLIRIGKVVGGWPTLAFVVAMGVLGAYLAKQQGRRVMQDWQRALAEGRIPEEGVLGGALILLGGLLLITPGVITDVLGLLLLLPWARRHLAVMLRAHLEQRMSTGTAQVQFFGMDWPAGAGSHPANVGARGRMAGKRAKPSDDVSRAPVEVVHGPLRGGVIVETEGEEVELGSERDAAKKPS